MGPLLLPSFYLSRTQHHIQGVDLENILKDGAPSLESVVSKLEPQLYLQLGSAMFYQAGSFWVVQMPEEQWIP